MRQAGHGRFDRESDALLGFQRRKALGSGTDLYLDVGDVGNGVDRQLLIAGHAHTGHRQNGQQHQKTLFYGELNDALKHEKYSSVRISARVPRCLCPVRT